MSILDAGIQDTQEFIKSLEQNAPQIEKHFELFGITDKKFYKLLKEGHTPASVMDISREELDGVYEIARRYITTGQIDKAQSMFIMLIRLDAMQPHFNYGLGLTYQMQGDVATAARFYLLFLGLDATNPEGYMRLGECLFAAKEYLEASETFEVALRMLTDPVKNYDDRQYAEKMKEAALRELGK